MTCFHSSLLGEAENTTIHEENDMREDELHSVSTEL